MTKLIELDDGFYVKDPVLRMFRPNIAKTYPTIKTTHEMRATLRAREIAWPGGYQMYLITMDGSALCFQCARKEYKQVSEAIKTPRSNDQWRVIGTAINYEDNDCTCDNCNRKIPASYGEE